jgi:DMSO/TMAO reductase YedYZ molybdopterin-dependent catalytic subunit
MADEPRLEIEGETARLALNRADLAALPAASQVADVGVLVPGRSGRAVRLAALLERVGSTAQGRHVHVLSRDPSFAVSVPLEELAGAVVVYAVGGQALDPRKGGPFRLLVPGHADECVHVKQVARLVLADRPGRDTRPQDDAEHAALHRKAKQH